MADKKISALPAATTPLAGTEVLPIVQGGTTDQVSVANLTVGRDVSAKTLTGESSGAGAVTEIFARNTAGPERVQIISRNSAGVSYLQTQNSQMLIGSFDNFAVQFMVNNSSKVVLETNSDVKVSTGNLVIGTTAKGLTTGSAIPLGFGVNNSVTAMTINTSSNVGVGTASPASKFNVVGDQIIIATADSTGVLGIQIKGTALSAIPAAQVQSYIATGNSSIGVAGDLLIAPRTDVAAGVRIITGTTPAERVIVNGSGNVGIGTSAPAATAILDVQSTTKGVRFPNMTTAQKTAITPSAGTVIFDTTLAKLCVYSGAAWQTITSV